MQRTPSTPPEIDGYLVEKLIGSGGFSDVFLYEQQLPRRKVAVKALLTHDLTPSARAAFTTEADLMARLSTHPYIVTIYQAGVARDGRPYLVMEYCSRPSLAERYKRQPLSVADALRTGIRLAGAVATAHQAGILHRDIKPGNVLTNDYGWPALTDFGIASDFAEEGARATAVGIGEGDREGSLGASVGISVPWSPPEMFVDAPSPDVRSDIFSLAATLHTVLAGRTPFEVPGGSNGTLELVARIERGELTPLPRDDVPPALLAALAKGMAPRRDDRYATVLELARALQRVELELGYAPTVIEVPIPDDEDPVGPGEGEETRVRAVHQVVAQPVTPEPSTPVSSTAVSSTPVPTTAVPTSSRRGPVMAVLLGVLAVSSVLAIALAVQLAGVAVRPAPAPSPAATGGPALVGPSVPQASDGVAQPSEDGTSVIFTWSNPAPGPGDVFYWARAETPADRAATREPIAAVTGIVPGSRICVNVEIGRAGATGAPLVICSS
jgi:serine/threonine protein kinase